MTEDFKQRFSGIGRLYGLAALERFSQAHVLVVGIGGVGAWVVESLARSGVGKISLVDLDDLCVTNVNRQIHALDSTIGQSKVEVMAKRIRDLNPGIEVIEHQTFYTEKNAEELFQDRPDCVIDAIDAIRPKCHLLAHCSQKNIPVIASGGAGGRRDAGQIQVADLAKTHGCALLLQVRKALRANYEFPSAEKKVTPFGIPAVFSSETPLFPTEDGCVSSQRPENLDRALRCDAGFGTSSPVIAIFGLRIAALTLDLLADEASNS